MRQLDVPETPLKVPDMPAALQAVFGKDTLRQVHGDDVVVTDFVPGTAGLPVRTVEFKVACGRVPAPIRRFVCGDRIPVTARQTLLQPSAEEWIVTNHIQVHCPGSGLFRMTPEFRLTKTRKGIVLSGRVRHDASLPPPLSWVAERFMCRHSTHHLRHFANVLRARGLLDP